MYKKIILTVTLIGVVALYFYYMTDNTQQKNQQLTGQTTVLNNDYFIKSPNEKRIHYSYVLDNGLQVLLISDPETKKSAASLDLNVGSGANPLDRLGMAHYLEHMLFLGTEKYPQADGFQEYIGSHGGSYNAYTAYRNTNYFFDVQKEYFEEALDRFSDFFKSPVFPQEFATRERNVVDSEFHTGLNDDGRRYYAVFQELLNQKHPMSKFSVGNKDTLSGDAEQLITDLRKFYSTYYRPSLMKLTVYSELDTDAMKTLTEKYFANLEPLDTASPTTTEPIISSEELPRIVQFHPIKEARYLDYYFPIATQVDNYLSKPAHFISYILNSENQGGLEDILKRKGWINGLHANLDVSLPEGGIFNIHFSVTPTGSAHIKEMTAIMFQALAQLRKHYSEEWRYDEIAIAKRNNFDFSQKRDALGYVRSLSRSMQLLPPQRWLSNGLWEEYNQDKIDEILQDLNPNNLLIVWVAPEADNSGKQEEYYAVNYSTKQLNQEELQEFLVLPPHQSIKIELPPANPFLSSEIRLIEGEEKLPQRLTNKKVNGWHKFNDSFNSPRVNLHLSIESTTSELSAKERMYDSLMVNLLNDKINQDAYQGGPAGYHADMGTTHYGIYISLSGYNEKFALWSDKILQLINQATFTQEDFNRILGNLKRSIRNREKDRPTSIIGNTFSNFMLRHSFANEDYLQELEQITLADIHQWRDKFFDKTRTMAFVYGNIRQQAAEDLVNKVITWTSEPLDDLVGRDKFMAINNQGRFIAQRDNQQGDSAAMLYYQTDGYDYKTRVATSLLARILQPQFFLKLRTEQELGYIVSAYYKKDHQRPGMAFTVQSNHKHSYDLVDRIDAFMDAVPEFLQDLSDDEFNEYKEGLLNLLAKPPQNFGEELSLYRGQIAEGFHNFDDRDKAVAELRKLSKPDIIEYSKSLLKDENSLVLITDDSITKDGADLQGKFITNIEEFKRLR